VDSAKVDDQPSIDEYPHVIISCESEILATKVHEVGAELRRKEEVVRISILVVGFVSMAHAIKREEGLRVAEAEDVRGCAFIVKRQGRVDPNVPRVVSEPLSVERVAARDHLPRVVADWEAVCTQVGPYHARHRVISVDVAEEVGVRSSEVAKDHGQRHNRWCTISVQARWRWERRRRLGRWCLDSTSPGCTMRRSGRA